MRVIWVIAVVTGILRAAAPPTFHKHMLPVLERHCQALEMMVGTVDVAIDAHMDPMDLYRPARKRSE
jgi:hypothetical protein